MRKGIVMEQSKRYMIVMTKDGQFHRAHKMAGAEIGMEVQFSVVEPRKGMVLWSCVKRHNHMKVAIFAIIFLLALFPAYSWYGSNQAYAYMNIDINPSVELELNDHMQVLDITPQNAEAEEIVASLGDWKKRDASEVTFDLINKSHEKGYVNEANQVLIGISYLQSEYDHDYAEEMEEYLTEQEEHLSVATFLVPDDLRRQAEKGKETVNELLADRLSDDSTEEEAETQAVAIEDDDKEIIQSFYNDDESSEGSEESVVPVEIPVLPNVEKKNPHATSPTEPEGMNADKPLSDPAQPQDPPDEKVKGRDINPNVPEKERTEPSVEHRKDKDKSTERKQGKADRPEGNPEKPEKDDHDPAPETDKLKKQKKEEKSKDPAPNNRNDEHS
ncbi:anti-sigma factor domain-containing protein [Halobacillus sp. KGW1]|uniref:anti-sigma-I factor RsgI family protein n=1 Tax=Halobacillus sp. KGW1 TaxID=1793726 RepID=UPI000784DEDF|nr:anti-sigma factor domain-containing protein [Halobacillus sp. KGW1]